MSTTTHEIAVKPRSEFGRNASRRARKAGLVPAVVYSKGQEGKAIYVDAREWAALCNSDFNLVTLIDGKSKTSALVKEVQVNYLKNEYIHIDFQEVAMNEAITASVAVHAAPGDPVGLSQGGLLEQQMHEIEVSSLPAALPESIAVDVSGLELDQHLLVKDIVLPEGVTAVTDGDHIVFTVMQPAAAASAASAEEEAAKTEAAGE
jgi:large subunit ribosomal protein L25